MELSRNLLKRFADITNDLKDRTRPVLAVYGTAVVREEKEDPDPDVSEVVTEDKDDNDDPVPVVKKIKYVRIDGSDILTPVSEATDIRDGDRVMVSIQDHVATVIGNVTCPPSARTATDLDPLLEAQSLRIDTLIAGQITTGYLDANYAKIDRLEAQSARIGVLEANQITTRYLDANYAKISHLEAQDARIKELEANQITTVYLEANYAKIDRLESQSARIGVLEANQITTEHLKANYADIDLANITQASVGRLFADIGLVSDMVISQGQITGELQGVKISASQLTAGKIDAADIEVVNLNASNITVGTINGQFIRPGTITAEALSAELNSAIAEKVDIQEALDQIEVNKAAAEKMVSDLRSDLGVVGTISVEGGNISSASITSEKIAANAVTADKIAANSVTAGKMSVATLSSITADVGTLTAGIIKSSNYTAMAGAVVSPYSRTGMLINLDTGLIQTPNLAVDASGNAYISGTIYASAGQIAGSLVTSGISAGNITTGTLSADRIAAGSISGSKMIAGTITATQIAASAVTSDKIAANAITSAKIAANAVTATQISAGAVTANKIASYTITATQISSGAITADKIAAGAITAAKIAAGAITADKLNVSGLSAISANIGYITAGEFGGFTISDKGIVATNKNVPYIFMYPGTDTVIGIEDRYGSYVRIEKTGVQSDTIKCLKIVNKNNTVGQTINLDGDNKSFVFSGGYHIRLETDVTTEVGIRIKNPKVSNYLSFIISAAGNKGIYDNNDATWMIMKNTSGIVCIPATYSKTTTGSANVNVNSSGALCRYTSSSQRYKHDIRYFSNVDNAVSSMSKRSAQNNKDGELLSILRLPVCSFLYNDGYVNGDIGYDPDRPIYGFIAEDVEHVSPDAVEYYVEPPKYDSMDREMSPERSTMIPESWDMKKLFPKAVYVLQKHEDEIKRYKAALTLLYNAVDKAGLLEPGIKEHVSQMIA